jgi:magnesium transporter
MINLFAAALAGVGVPLILRKMGIDPALAGSVVLTTVTDTVGFASLLGLGTLFLTYVGTDASSASHPSCRR